MKRINEYLNFVWSNDFENEMKEEHEILNYLNLNLKTELLNESHSSMLSKSIFFSKFMGEDILK